MIHNLKVETCDTAWALPWMSAAPLTKLQSGPYLNTYRKRFLDKLHHYWGPFFLKFYTNIYNVQQWRSIASVLCFQPALFHCIIYKGAADIIMAPCDVANSSVCRWTHLGYKSVSSTRIMWLSFSDGTKNPVFFIVGNWFLNNQDFTNM